MNEMLRGVDKFGLGDLGELELFAEKGKEIEEESLNAAAQEMFEINDVTYEKEFKCGVCRNMYKSRVMRLGKMMHVAIDYDLRPIYKEPIHPIYYDVHICPHCGHAALSQMLTKLNSVQIKLVQENISPKFKSVEYPAQLDAAMAIERYKLALLNAVVKNSKDSEKAYLCMKTAWIYRSVKDKKNEIKFITSAYQGFTSALENEHFPVFGMDDDVVTFIAASYAKTLGLFDEGLKMLGTVIVSKKSNSRLKDRAHDLKQDILQERESKQSNTKGES